MGANLTFNDNDDVQLKGATDQTLIGNNGDKLKVDGSGVTQPVSATSLPLPTGASTSTLQTTGNTSVASIDTKTPTVGQKAMAGSTPVVIASDQSTVPVSAATLPLPTGASTSALQTTGNSSLSSIDTKTPALITGRVPVDGSGVTQPISVATLPLPTGAATAANQSTEITSLSSIDSKLTTTNTSLSSIDAGIPAALGQTTMTASMPVVFASDQTTITTTAVPTDGIKATYSAAIISSTLGTLATDFFTITGSATKLIRVTEISVAFTGGGTIVSAQLLKRSTANSGGTSSLLTATPHDTNDTASTATVRVYTANPTVGTLVGVMRADKTDSPLLSSTTNPNGIVYTFGTRPSRAVVLRGINQVLAFNLNGVTLSGGAVSCYVEWTEE